MQAQICICNLLCKSTDFSSVFVTENVEGGMESRKLSS